MIDHITIGVTDIERSSLFYDCTLAPLGINRLFEAPKTQANEVALFGYGDDRPRFWIAEEKPTNGMLHIAFQAASRRDVDAFYAAAVKAGGRENGPPGLRPHYHSTYYAAFILDPDGHNIEAVCHRA